MSAQRRGLAVTLRPVTAVFALGLAFAATPFAATPGPANVNPQTYLSEVAYLASPALKGRATGSPELEKAAHYIADHFKSFGLQPVNGATDYLQPFPVTLEAKLGPQNLMSATDDGKTKELRLAQDFIPFSFSGSGKASGDVVFVGYGITAPEYHYDDYAGLDVKDKFVLVLRHEPQEHDARSVFAGRDLTHHATFGDKEVNAKMHGARGVIVVNDMAAHPSEGDDLLQFGRATGPTGSGVFVLQVTYTEAEAWAKAEGHNLDEIQEEIDKDLQPRSFALTKLRVSVDFDILHETKTVHNVVAYLPGQTNEYVIVGAHYDHLGLGDEHSLAPSQIGTIHPGADDNASGTAGVIELARYFSAQYPPGQPKPKRGILFMTFAGEELGLLGSSWYVNHPLLPIDDAVAMINMDMIGRIRSGKVYINGSGTGDTLTKLVEDTTAPHGLHFDLSEQIGYGGSDHQSFTIKQVPVLFFFSGLHGDYHKPSDTADKINAPGAAELLGYVAQVTTELADEAGRPKFVRLPEPKHGGISGGGGSGYGPNFGSVPDFNEPPKGVRFADIIDGTPAAKAGLKAGDILIEFDGKPIGNLYDFTYALRAHKPGDLVRVKVIRGNQEIEAKVLLTERR